jgi:hypothetical protein
MKLAGFGDYICIPADRILREPPGILPDGSTWIHGEMKMKLNALTGILLLICVSALFISPVSAADGIDYEGDAAALEWLEHVIETGPKALDRAGHIIGLLAEDGYDVDALKTLHHQASAAYARASYYFDHDNLVQATSWAQQFAMAFYDMIWGVCELVGVNNLFNGMEHAYFATFFS